MMFGQGTQAWFRKRWAAGGGEMMNGRGGAVGWLVGGFGFGDGEGGEV